MLSVVVDPIVCPIAKVSTADPVDCASVDIGSVFPDGCVPVSPDISSSGFPIDLYFL